MKLSQFLSALTTANVSVDLVDMETGSVLATIQASSFSVLEDTIESREVKQWSIISLSHIKVVIGAVIEDTNTEPETPAEP